jgi:hypothetical protein
MGKKNCPGNDGAFSLPGMRKLVGTVGMDDENREGFIPPNPKKGQNAGRARSLPAVMAKMCP